MQSHYEINVSLNGKHFFATAPRSCVSQGDTLYVLAKIRARFPEEEGFEVSCTYWEVRGMEINS